MGKQVINAPIEVVESLPVLPLLNLPIRENAARRLRSTALAAARDTSATYQYGEAENGYGRCYGGEVTVQIGTAADINIDFNVHAISDDTFTQWHSTASQYFSSDQWSYLEEHYSAGGGLFGGFLGACLGFLCGGGHYDHYMNKRDTFSSAGSQQADGFLNSVHDLDDSVLRMQGHLTARGVSYIPVSVTAYIKVTKITFADGKTLHAVDLTNPIAAADNGNTSGVVSDPTTLHIVSTN
jgi:hypothetical protein